MTGEMIDCDMYTVDHDHDDSNLIPRVISWPPSRGLFVPMVAPKKRWLSLEWFVFIHSSTTISSLHKL